MRLLELDVDQALTLVQKVDKKFRSAWDRLPPNDQASLARYFLPHNSSKPILEPTRPRVIKWYCPFADQKDFASGHRYCINVYTGCDHKCLYCYAISYEPEASAAKAGFEKLICKDMEDLDFYDVPPAPVHLSNSTDPFQPLERKHQHSRYALEQILAHRRRFTTVTILTKNPLLSVELGYVDIFKELMELPANHPMHRQFNQEQRPGFIMEISLAFWQESVRRFYDPGAPTVEERIEGIRTLHKQKIPLVLRIDPLFPRSPLKEHPCKTLADFGLPEPQTIEDLEKLVLFARDMSVRHIVYSPAKIVKPRGRKLSGPMQALRAAYETFASPEKLIWRGGSWRLPPSVAEARIVNPLLQICRQYGMITKYCKQNLIETP